MYGSASISRAWLPEMLLVREERGSVVGVEERERRQRENCCPQRCQLPLTDDPFVLTRTEEQANGSPDC